MGRIVHLNVGLSTSSTRTTNVGPRTLMDECYTTLAGTWLGLPAADLLPGSPSPSVGSRILGLRLGVRRAQNPALT